MPLLKTTFKIKTLNQRGVVRYLFFFLLTHSVVASTSDSGSDNGGSSPPGSTILGMWRNWLDAIVLGTIGLSSCGFDSPIAQLVELLALNQEVQGSSPCGGTFFKIFND